MKALGMTILLVLCLCPLPCLAEGKLGPGVNNRDAPLEGDVDFGNFGTPKRPISPKEAVERPEIPIVNMKPSGRSDTENVRKGIADPPKPDNSRSPSNEKKLEFKVTAKEPGPFNLTAVVTGKKNSVPLEDTNENPPPDDAEDSENERMIRVYQSEINKRQQTNSVLKSKIDDDAGWLDLKDMLRNSISDASGNVNEELLGQQPQEIQEAIREFESGHWGRDLRQSFQAFFNAASSTFTADNFHFYIEQAQVEIRRNEMFIQMLQSKINKLKDSP